MRYIINTVFILVLSLGLPALINLNMLSFFQRDTSYDIWTFNSRALGSEVVKNSPLTVNLKDSFAWLRLQIRAGAEWLLIVEDPYQKGMNQAILRGEILDELNSTVREEKTKRFFTWLKQESTQIKARVVVLLVPTKIFANKLQLSEDFVRDDEDWKRIGGKPGSERVGFEKNWNFAISAMQDVGLSFIDLLPIYKQLQQQDSLLYPRGDSHWSVKTIFFTSKFVVNWLQNEKHLPQHCFLSEPAFTVITSDHNGDLAEAIGYQLNSWIGRPFKTATWQKWVLENSPPTLDKTCPPLVYLGTSYGTAGAPDATFVDGLKARYKGDVKNYSENGAIQKNHWENLKDEFQKLPSNALVIFEMPFRALKDFEDPNATPGR